MRGARIAEKIQEFYHTTGSSFVPNSAGTNGVSSYANNTASSSKLKIFNKQQMTAG